MSLLFHKGKPDYTLILISLLNSSANSFDAQQMPVRQLAPTLDSVRINTQTEQQIDTGNGILMKSSVFIVPYNFRKHSHLSHFDHLPCDTLLGEDLSGSNVLQISS